MKSLRNFLTLFIVLGSVTYSLICASTYSVTIGQNTDCIGEERWMVKSLQDKNASKINFIAKEISIKYILRKERSVWWIGKKNSPRLKDEYQVYKVRGTVPYVQKEDDGDIHIQIVDIDNPELTLIAEIPNPDCTINEKSKYKEMFRNTRDDFISNHYLDREIYSQGVFEITGVLFHDSRNHSKYGGNYEGVELHPAISIRKIR